MKRLLAPTGIAIVLAIFIAALIRSYYSVDVLATTPNRQVVAPAVANRLLLVVIDGLRADTLYDTECMPALRDYAKARLHGESLATDITMTGVGVRAIGTGTSSGISTIFKNWDQTAIEFDNLFASLSARGGRIAVIGNHTWTDLFGRLVTTDLTQKGVTNFMHHVNPVYGADVVWSSQAVDVMHAHDWNLAVVHLGGLDNASHLYTPFGKEFCAKAHNMDDDVMEILSAAGANTTAIVTSDHGTGNQGHHGSGEPEARRSPVVLSGPGFLSHGEVAIHQVDLAPTMAALLGLPIPFPAEGHVLTEWLDVSTDTRMALQSADLERARFYASSFAAFRHLPTPTITSPADLGTWLESIRSDGIWLPLVLALALLFMTIALCQTRSPPLSLQVLGLLLCVVGVLIRERTSIVLGIGASIIACTFAWSVLRPLPRRSLLLFFAVLIPAQVAVVYWRLHLRIAQIDWILFKRHVHGDAWLWIVLVLIGALFAHDMLGRFRKTEWFDLGALALFALCGDQMAIPAALGALIVVALRIEKRSDQLVTLGLIVLSALACSYHPVTSKVPWLWGPLLVGGLALFRLDKNALRFLPLLFGMVGTLVLWRRNEIWLFRSYLIFGALFLVVSALALPRHRRVSAAVLLVQLAFLSRMQHLLGILLIALTAILLGEGLRKRASDGKDVRLEAALATLGIVLLYFWLFESFFSFSSLEIWVGYASNPGQNHIAGGLAIAYKLLLPMFVAAWLVLSELPQQKTALAWVAVFFCMRLSELAFTLMIGARTFHSPYADAGHVLFNLIFLGSVGLVISLSYDATPETEARPAPLGSVLRSS